MSPQSQEHLKPRRYTGDEGQDMKWFILFMGIAANASASVLIKLALMPPRHLPSLTSPKSAMENWPFWLGLFLYGIAFLLYAAALQRLPLNVAHPILTAGAVAVVAILSILVFKEPMPLTTAIGICLVGLGVVLITLRNV